MPRTKTKPEKRTAVAPKPKASTTKPKKKGEKKSPATPEPSAPVAPTAPTVAPASVDARTPPVATPTPPPTELPKSSTPVGDTPPASVTEDAPRPTPKVEESRLPPAGTVIQKLDRAGKVRCECTVVTDGVSYAGTVYRSLSAAAIAAAKELGLAATSMNGYSFWGLTKPVRSSAANPLAGLERAWDRYQRHLGELLERTKAGEQGETVLATVLRHARVLQNLHDEVAEKALPACPACGGEGQETVGEQAQPCRSCQGEGVLRRAS